MESPPSCSTWSETFPSSDDSGLLLTSGHSGSVSSESAGSGACNFVMELPESDIEEKSLSQDESLDFSDGMCGENFNTLKKGPGWPELTTLADGKHVVTIEPPPEFQDSPPSPPVLELLGYKCKEPLLEDSSVAVTPPWLEKFASKLVAVLIEEALSISCKVTWSIQCSQDCHPASNQPQQPLASSRGRWSGPRLCWTPELLPFSSPCNRPSSRSSLASSRLSSSHNSLSVPAANKADDSSFITSAMSHDVLTASEISDMYNVPFDSDIYAVPIDVVRPPRTPQRPKRQQRHHRKRRRHTSSSSQTELERSIRQQTTLRSKTGVTSTTSSHSNHVTKSSLHSDTASESGGTKRHSVPGPSAMRQIRSASTECPSMSMGHEPIHMTLHEVRQYLQNLYSSSSDSSDNKSKNDAITPKHQQIHISRTAHNNNNNTSNNRNNHRCINEDAAIDFSSKGVNGNMVNSNVRKNKKNTFVINIKNKKAKESSEVAPTKDKETTAKTEITVEKEKTKKSPSGKTSFSTNLKQTLCNIFRIRKLPSPDHQSSKREMSDTGFCLGNGAITPNEGVVVVPPSSGKAPFLKRALPPLPDPSDAGDPIPDVTPLPSPEDAPGVGIEEEEADLVDEPSMDFASSIEKVKDYGWYWGPISGEAAEKILSNEPDGSFIVRDSSDDHYIFSLTFKLNGCIRHVRIEHDQGNFSFGSCTKFKSHTIVDFIENAVEHSRSGRYLFFLHRRPVLGPMRVQLLHPVSRFKQVQSLQHMCRFVILKLVRRDLISTLPLPRRLIDYLSTPHYYSEQLVVEEEPLQQREASSLTPSPHPDDIDMFSFVPQGLS